MKRIKPRNDWIIHKRDKEFELLFIYNVFVITLHAMQPLALSSSKNYKEELHTSFRFLSSCLAR